MILATGSLPLSRLLTTGLPELTCYLSTEAANGGQHRVFWGQRKRQTPE
jgi:hypothetical protein